MKELTRITKRLSDAKVEYVIAGGLGTLLHGSALMTRDVDVACRMDPENLLRIFSAFEELHPTHRNRAMGRPRDFHAVLELEAIRERLRGKK